jgi:hypothetical protein
MGRVQMGYGEIFVHFGAPKIQNDNEPGAVRSAPVSAISPGNTTMVRGMQWFPSKQELHDAFTEDAVAYEQGDGEYL